MNFVKMHGLGNDFIMIDETEHQFNGDRKAFSVKYCSRNFGVGADGVIFMQPGKEFKMQIINADGSEAEMCGNGIRCMAKYLMDRNLAKSPVSIETGAGTLVVEKNSNEYRVDMGEGKILGKKNSNGQELITVSMGNPHAVIFVEDYDFDWKELGRKIETDSAVFPQKTNVEFVKVLSEKKIMVNVWERGAGPTLACGTGACATLVAGASVGKTGRKADIVLPGGTLHIEWLENGHVMMTGPAEEVFAGSMSGGN
jgi:diaminopimelate epimerase